MKILGIDYGRRKIGLAIGDDQSRLAEPLKVLRLDNEEEVINKAEKVVQEEQVEQVIMGISEGKIGNETKEFGKRLELRLNLPIIFQDETLSTQEAQKLAIEAGIRRKKRKSFDDAYSAALILQDYFDSLKRDR